MTSTLSRRGLVGAAPLAMFATTFPALVTEPGPIEAMYSEYVRLEEAFDSAFGRVMDAEQHYEEPERPRWHPFHEEGGYKTIMTSRTHGYSVLDDGAENIAYLKETIAREYKPDADEWDTRNRVRGRRASKTLAKIEAWQAEVKRRKSAAGLPEAESAKAEACQARDACCEAIFDMEPSTYRELAFQAAVLDLHWEHRWVARVQERLLKLADVTPYWG